MLKTAVECKDIADKANAKKDSFIEREVTAIVSYATVKAKKGEYELYLYRILDNNVVKRLEELGYKCHTSSTITIISWV